MHRNWWEGAVLLSSALFAVAVPLLLVVFAVISGYSKDVPHGQLKGGATTPVTAKADDSHGWWCPECQPKSQEGFAVMYGKEPSPMGEEKK